MKILFDIVLHNLMLKYGYHYAVIIIIIIIIIFHYIHFFSATIIELLFHLYRLSMNLNIILLLHTIMIHIALFISFT